MNDNGLQGGKEMFLEIKDLKKGFGSGDLRIFPLISRISSQEILPGSMMWGIWMRLAY